MNGRAMDATILFLAINLQSSAERRMRLKESACRAGIDLVLVPAVTGDDVARIELGFDRERRRKEFSVDLLPTELACVESHLWCLRRFLDLPHTHCVVLEDDASFEPVLSLAVSRLIQTVAGWDFIKLWSPGANWPLGRVIGEDCPLEVIYPKNISRDALAILYSREGARKVLERMGRYWMAFDTQLGYVCCRHGIVGVGVSPPLCVPSPGLPSSIDAGGRRARAVPPSIKQRMCHRVQRLLNSWYKRRLYRMVRRVIRFR